MPADPKPETTYRVQSRIVIGGCGPFPWRDDPFNDGSPDWPTLEAGRRALAAVRRKHLHRTEHRLVEVIIREVCE